MTESCAPRRCPQRVPPSRLFRVGLLAVTASVSACAWDGADPPSAAAQEPSHAFRVDTVATGLAHPWGLAFLPGGDMLVTERPGRLRIIRNGVLDPAPIGGVPAVHARGQGGLLDVALHPQFASNRLVYLSYSKPGPDGATTAVARGRLDGGQLTNVEDVFVAQAWSTAGQHFGSRIVFDRQGYMFVSVGDRGHSPNAENQNAQNLMVHAGSVMRLHDDGRTPADNPFVGRTDALPEIFTWGNRNIQGMALDPATGHVWATEHGARGGDELNRLQPGRNYGWPVITHGVNYNGQPIGVGAEKEGMEQPVHFWVPSIATSGTAFYTGDRFPRWKGDVFVGGLAGMQLVRITLRDGAAAGHEVLLSDFRHRIRDVRDGPDGYIYLLTDAASGTVVRLMPRP